MRRHHSHNRSRAEKDVQVEKIGLNDFFLNTLLAGGVFFLLEIWSYPFLTPNVWTDAAAAAGVRPAETLLPGSFTFVAKILYGIFGIGGGSWMLRLVGQLTVAAMAAMVYTVIRQALALIMRSRRQQSHRRTIVTQIASLTGAIAFALSEPVWNAGQCLSPVTIQLSLAMAALVFFFAFLRKGTLKWSYFCAIALGLLSAETPFGVVLTVLLVALNFFVINKIPSLDSPFFKPAVIQIGKWYMTFIYIAAILVGVAIECGTYIGCGALEASGASAGDIPLRYLLAYWGALSGSVTKPAAILMGGVCLVPFVVALLRFPQAADEEKFLPYGTGIAFIVCGAFTMLQFSPLPATWFWTYATVENEFVLAMALMLCATTIAFAITVLGVDAICRDHERLASQFFGTDGDLDVRGVRVSHVGRRVRNALLLAIPVLIVLVMIPGRRKSTMRGMLEVVRDAVRQTVDEAGDARHLFTDGNLDAIIELEAARMGRPRLKCHALVGGGRNAQYLRMRGLDGNSEDEYSFSYDTAMGLRGWIRNRPEKLAESAVQMGFDLWKRDGKALPLFGGLLSRPAGVTNRQRAEAIARSRALSARALEVLRKGGYGACTWPCVKSAFCNVLWRLARMCHYRGEAADYAGDAKTAIAEVTLEKALNANNATYARLQAAMGRRNEQMMTRLTPLEGLQLSLVRADFTMGKTYADVIIGADPENPDANFALGMYYLKERQLTRAEEYLKRCLIRKPTEPAIYNNLAMIEIELGKFDAAEANVEKALKLIPDSAAVLDTRKVLKQAREEAAKRAEEKKEEKKR